MLTGLGVDEVFSRTDSSRTGSFLTDALGSTLALADGTGTVQTRYTYDPFGNPSSTGASSSNTQQYTGRENDGTGLQYNRARHCSPALQRFISEDPLGFGGGDVNLYAYAGNDPINATDPSGQFIIGFIAAVGLLGCGAGAWYGWTHSHKDRWTYAAGDALVGCAAGVAAGTDLAQAAMAAAVGAGAIAADAVVQDSTEADTAGGWQVGDPVDAPTSAGNNPSWSTVRSRYWKNIAANASDWEYTDANIARMKKGLAPIEDSTGASMELHHIVPRGEGGSNAASNLQPLWPWQHAAIDPHRFYTGPMP